jgi:DNA-binding transcriptional MerR regulator
LKSFQLSEIGTIVSRVERRYKAKEVCAIFDIAKVTLFRWEREGLISNVGRDWRNWRLYSEKNIKEIKKIIRLRNEKRM